jgi:regulatory protein
LSGSDGQSATETYQRALNLLARRDHSVAELGRKLIAKGFPPARVEEALETLVRQGYLDDRRFAERWAESALASGRFVGSRLLLELLRRGIDRETAREAVAAVGADQSERQLLATLAAKRFATFDPAHASLRERRRVYAFLARRGFSPAAITAFFGGMGDEE